MSLQIFDTFIISFIILSAADKVLRSSQYEFKGMTFEVHRPRSHSMKRKERAKPNPETPMSVIVTYKDKRPDADELELWMEDTDNGGGHVDRIEHDQVNRRFLVVFEDPKRKLASKQKVEIAM